MTKLYGYVSAWPEYITIGNLSRATRRKQTVPSCLLLGFIPIIKDVSTTKKNTYAKEAQKIKQVIYHFAM